MIYSKIFRKISQKVLKKFKEEWDINIIKSNQICNSNTKVFWPDFRTLC